MSRRARVGAIAALGVVAAVVAHVIDAGAADDLALLAAGLVIGELLVLRLEDRTAVPLSYAVLVVLASSFELREYALTVLAAQLVAHLVARTPAETLRLRLVLLSGRLAVAAATFAAYRATTSALDHRETVAAVLVALGAAALAQAVVDSGVRLAARLSRDFTIRTRLAWLAVASSGMLMAIGYRGVDGRGDVGIWGPLLFATPLLAAWYAFERLDSATLSYRQTIESLAMAPEFGGLVVAGHAQRVAALSVAMAHDLGLGAPESDDLEKAALLHHLGQVTLEDPEVAGRPDPGEVAAVTGGMLREIRPLAAAGEIVGGDTADARRRTSAQILRLASAYDDLTAGDGTPSGVAIEALRSAPGYVYDERVVGALERAVRAHSVPV